MTKRFWIKTSTDGRIYGPHTVDEIRQIAAADSIRPQDYLSPDGHNWTLASKVQGLELPSTRSRESTDNGSRTLPADSENPISTTGIDLCAVSKYRPSGKCSYPQKLAYFFPGILAGSAVAGAIGYGAGVLFGVILCKGYVSAFGSFADKFGADFDDVATSIGLNFGGWIGAACGIGIAIGFIGETANRVAHNRSTEVTKICGYFTVLTMTLLYGIVWFGFSEFESLGTSRYFGLFTIALGGILGVEFAAARLTGMPYCESCKTYLKKCSQQHFSVTAYGIMDLASVGDVQELAALEVVTGSDWRAEVLLLTCKDGCSAAIEISEKTKEIESAKPSMDDNIPGVSQVKGALSEQAKAAGLTQDKYTTVVRVLLSGMIDARQRESWSQILRQVGS